MRQSCNADADITGLRKKASARYAIHRISLQDVWGVGIEPQLGENNMGYDITVKKTKFHRWFSVWNWHRCIASAIFGLGELNDEEYKDELYAVTDLQQNGLPKNKDGEAISKAEIHTKMETKDVEKTIIEVNIDYDDELRAIGAAALIPVPKRMAEAKDFNPKEFAEMIGGTVAIQVRTNNLLHDHKKKLQLENKDCQLLSSMEGKEIKSEVPMKLAVGLGSCLEKISPGFDSKMVPTWTSMMNDMEMPENIQQELFGPMLAMFNESAKHELSFEITEYLEGESMASLASALAVMVEAMFSGSEIVIE